MKIGRFMQKKSVVAALCGIVLVGIGATWAFSHDLSVMNNNLALANYQVTYTEEFVSPDNWQTCQTVPKTVTVTNNSNVDVAVRIMLEEDWIASDGTTHLPLTSAASGLVMAQINFTENSGWTRDGEYFVYDTDLAPNATTSSLITGVTLNCDANLNENADGAYGGAEYHLKATIQTIEADGKDEWNQPTLAGEMIKQANAPYEVDFTRAAEESDDEYTRNGNGVNKYTERGRDVYYFRGEVMNNNVIWKGKCWKIVRTTYTGGTKMIYGGVPVDFDGAQRCYGSNAWITYNGSNDFQFNDNQSSPADVGYMYGARITFNSLFVPTARTFTFSNDVVRSGDTYTLDTSVGQSITGTWADQRTNAATRYHYFCKDGTATCDNTQIAYIYNFGAGSQMIYYLDVGGYDNIEDMKTAMFANDNDSVAKTTIEAWFEEEGLDAYEDDLEDVVFCNDRSIYSGSLKGKDSAAPYSGVAAFIYFGAWGRNAVKNSNNNYEPNLDCPNKNDSFTKDDITNGNGKLRHKVGLITEDELTLAGSYLENGDEARSYLYHNWHPWSISPKDFDESSAHIFTWHYGSGYNYSTSGASRLLPMVSLKAGTTFVSGTGLDDDPYIVP